MLLEAEGLPSEAITLALPYVYQKGGHKWTVIVECWKIPTSNIAPLEGEMVPDLTPWWEASRIVNRVLRHGNSPLQPAVTINDGGWAGTYVLSPWRGELRSLCKEIQRCHYQADRNDQLVVRVNVRHEV